MNAQAVPLLCAAILGGTVLYVSSAKSEVEPQTEAADPALNAELVALAQEVRTFSQRIGDLEGEISRLQTQVPSNRQEAGDLDEAIRRVLADMGSVQPAETADSAEAAVREPVEDLLAQLFELEEGLEREEFWQRMRDEGRMDEVIAAFEARAEANPSNPDFQVDLGEAYLQKIQEVGNGPLAGVLATQADDAFNRALDVDPEHWNARFTKAIALSFWPKFTGKQGQAISELETLVAQQASANVEPHHVQSHLILGNLYQDSGQTEKAIAAWQAGLALFPQNEALIGQLQLASGNGE